MSKSYVTLEQKLCFFCGNKYDTDSILMDRRLKDSFDMHTIAGWGKCPECKKLAEIHVCFIECKNTGNKQTLTKEEMNRTGRLVWVTKEATEKILPNHKQAFVAINEETFEKLFGEALKENENEMDKEKKT